jgi:nucleoside-diphosphate-sugar epimerase
MRILVLGASGFIGNYLVNHFQKKGNYVCGVDINQPKFNFSNVDEFIIGDLREKAFVNSVAIRSWDLVFHFAADMGGAGYVFTKTHDADILSSSLQITINLMEAFKHGKQTLVYASSACVYPEHNQLDINNLKISEESAYPASPDSNYGWEKLTGERLCQSFASNYNMDNRIIRLHNIYGPLCSYNNGKEKSPAALCRKVVESNGKIEVWGDGNQIRSYLYINDLLNAIDLLLQHNIKIPINVGNEHYITINDLAKLIIKISNKNISIVNKPGPIGVNARTSDNTLIRKLTGWEPQTSLEDGIKQLYYWIENEIKKEKNNE